MWGSGYYMAGVGHKHSDSVFVAAKTKKLTGKYRKADLFTVWIERIMIPGLAGGFLFLLFHPGFSLLDYPMVVLWLPLFIALSASTNWSMHLGWNQRLDGRMKYGFEEKELIIYFNKNILQRIPYEEIRWVENLDQPLTKLGGVQLYGRKYWYSFMSGTSNEYPMLMVFGTALDEGLIIKRPFDWILITPEDVETFTKKLQDKKAEHTA